MRLRARRVSLLLGCTAVLGLGVFTFLLLGGFIRIDVLNANASISGLPLQRGASVEVASAASAARPQLATPERRTHHAKSQREREAGATSIEVRKSPAAGVEPVTLRIEATRGVSWLVARQTNAAGKVIYEGTLSQGANLTLRGHVLWVRFGALANLDLFFGNKPLTLVHTGTVDALFTTSGVQAG